ncbi:hypothetical protein LINPERHAP1_LOCUS4860, partial [Linum perenne]
EKCSEKTLSRFRELFHWRSAKRVQVVFDPAVGALQSGNVDRVSPHRQFESLLSCFAVGALRQGVPICSNRWRPPGGSASDEGFDRRNFLMSGGDFPNTGRSWATVVGSDPTPDFEYFPPVLVDGVLQIRLEVVDLGIKQFKSALIDQFLGPAPPLRVFQSFANRL